MNGRIARKAMWAAAGSALFTASQFFIYIYVRELHNRIAMHVVFSEECI